jgi:hypothetical protein
MKQLNIELENAWIVRFLIGPDSPKILNSLGQIDTTREFLEWCKSQQFSIIDLNMHPLIPQNEVSSCVVESEVC